MLRTLLRSAALLLAVAARAGSVEAVHGTVRRDAIYSHLLGVPKNMVVYLPPSYDHSPYATKRYPVAVYLHGRWGDETDWLTLGHLAQSMDSLVTQGLHEMIVVMPDGDEGWWMTWALPNDTAACRRTPHRHEPPAEFCVVHPRYDEYLAREVLPYIDATYRTIPSRESRGIVGLSMGGYGALAVAAKYPELFSVAISHGGAITPGIMADSSELSRTGQVVWRQGRTTSEKVYTTDGVTVLQETTRAYYTSGGEIPQLQRHVDPPDATHAERATSVQAPSLSPATAGFANGHRDMAL